MSARRLLLRVIGEHSRPSKHDLSPRSPRRVLETSQPIRETPALTPMTQCVHQRAQMPPRIGVRLGSRGDSRNMEGTSLQHPLQSSLGGCRLCQILRHIGQAESGKRRVEHLESVVEGELAVDADFEFAITFFELPGVQAAVRGQTQIDAVMTDQVLGLLRFWSLFENTTARRRPRCACRVRSVRRSCPSPLVHRRARRRQTLGNDVSQAVVDEELDLDVRIVRAEVSQASARGVSSTTCSVAVMRMAPAGLSRSSLTALDLGVDFLKSRTEGLQAAVRPLASGRRCAWCA